MSGTLGPVLASLSLIGLAIALSTWIGLRIERDIVIATVRAAVQLLAVGVLFTTIFESSNAVVLSWLWVLMMLSIATSVVYRRAAGRIRGLALPAGLAIAASAALSLAVTFGFDVIEFSAVSLVVIAGITVGNTVPSAVLGVNQSMNLAKDRPGDIEALLSLGFNRRQVVRFMAPRAAKAALLPQIERTKVVGLIALPGAMTGLLLAGTDPVEAVIIQLLVMYLILGTAALNVVTAVWSVMRASVTAELTVATWVSDHTS